VEAKAAQPTKARGGSGRGQGAGTQKPVHARAQKSGVPLDPMRDPVSEPDETGQ
jgi:hypothetical protein